MSASLDIQTNRADHVLSVPVQSVVVIKDTTESSSKKSNAAKTIENKQREVVYLYQNGTAKVKNVKTGIQDNYNIEIKEGLSEKDEVITGPYSILTHRLKDNMAVVKIEKKDIFKKKK
jgi:HlyD family secretion protein